MRRRFLLSPQAKSDLRNILLDIAEDSPDAAERLRSEIYEAFQRLGRSPGIGHYHDELLNRRYRFWNFYSYVICYVWKETHSYCRSCPWGTRLGCVPRAKVIENDTDSEMVCCR